MKGPSELYTLLLSVWFTVFKTFKPSFRAKRISLKIRSFFGLGSRRSSKPKPRSNHHPSLVISSKRMAEIEGTVRKHLEEKKSFLQHGYTLKMFSEETQINIQYLSVLINKY